MKFIKSQSASGGPADLFYEDWGTGNPIVFIHGWPLDHQMWEYQTSVLPALGFRCIAYDRRGFGKSDKTWSGYDYDTFADDLKAVLDSLDLQNVTLVGFSMGGGEVVRYFSRHGGNRVAKVVLLASVAPYLLKTNDNADGVPKEVFDDIINSLKKDRGDFLTGLLKVFYGVNDTRKPVSQSLLNWNLALGMQAMPKATIDCVRAFGETDFRSEMNSIKVPALVIHGDADQIVPIKPTGEHAAQLIPNAIYKVYTGGPHGLLVTEKDKFNDDLIDFIKG